MNDVASNDVIVQVSRYWSFRSPTAWRVCNRLLYNSHLIVRVRIKVIALDYR